MYNKEVQLKSIKDYIKNDNQELSREEIEFLEYIHEKIVQSQNDEELLKWNNLLVLFLATKELDKIKKDSKRDKILKWTYLLVKLFIILASILYHHI